MSRYLYISDVYCPWCYAFGRILDELLAEHPLPVRVLAGELVEEPQARTSDCDIPACHSNS